MKTLDECILEIQKSGAFLGGPQELFEDAGRKMLMLLLNEGLMPYSKVLDLGCGCLRGGYWLIRFLDKSCYFGIEPNKNMLKQGIKSLLTPKIMRQKKPTFQHNTKFDASVFNTHFDYFLARSIWTHASKIQIEAMLDSYSKCTQPSGKFLTSFLQPDTSNDDYTGTEWIGKSHESNEAGIVKHSLNWIESACDDRGLICELITDSTFDLNNNQRWIKISKIQ